MKSIISAGIMILCSALGAQQLTFTAQDVEVEPREDGFHLFIRKTPGTASVLLTESFELKDHSLPSYALRGFEKNLVNGDELRLLDGKPLANTIFSLIDSTTEPRGNWAEGAFHILIPPKVQYGYPDYPNTRYKSEDLGLLAQGPDRKFWFSIRAFSKPYGDYSGNYKDNAFELFSYEKKAEQVPSTPVQTYQPRLEQTFDAVSDRTLKSTGPEELVSQITNIISTVEGKSLDLVLVVDTTKSMVEEMGVIKANLLTPIKEQVARFESYRIGFVFYRDYMEEYLNRVVDFQKDFQALQRDLDRITASGGGDVPEAVYEALYAGSNTLSWEGEKRVMILVGDAPAHELPRGRVTKDILQKSLQEKNIDVVSIILPYSGP